MIAMALACEPRLVIADEPTTALDVMVQAQVLRLLAGWSPSSGIGLMMISHDLSVLAATCQRLAVMYAGRIVEDGPRAEVMRDAAAPAHQGAGRGVPDGRRPGLPTCAAGLTGDPPDPRICRRMPVPSALPVSTSDCRRGRAAAAVRPGTPRGVRARRRRRPWTCRSRGAG